MYVETYGKQAGRQVGGQARGSVGRFRLEMSVCNECTGDEFGRSESGSRLWVWVVSGPPMLEKGSSTTSLPRFTFSHSVFKGSQLDDCAWRQCSRNLQQQTKIKASILFPVVPIEGAVKNESSQ